MKQGNLVNHLKEPETTTNRKGKKKMKEKKWEGVIMIIYPPLPQT